MAYVLGCPTQWEGNEIMNHNINTTELDNVVSGVIVSKNSGGEVVPYNDTLVVFGVSGKKISTGQVDVLTKGYRLPIKLMSGVNPNGKDAFVSTGGLLDITGTVKIGTFVNSTKVSAYDPTTMEVDDNCALVDILINSVTIAPAVVSSPTKNVKEEVK